MATINDVVLVHVDKKPGFYARIEEISPDVKPGWWQVRLLVFTFPLQVFTWILDDFQIEGADFTMGGTPIRLDPAVGLCPLRNLTDQRRGSLIECVGFGKSPAPGKRWQSLVP